MEKLKKDNAATVYHAYDAWYMNALYGVAKFYLIISTM